MKATMRTDLTPFYRQMAGVRMDMRTAVEKVLFVVGTELVNWLKSTDPSFESVGPKVDRRGGHSVDVHPGGWMDDTTNMRDRHGFKVMRTTRGYRLRLFNDAEYAVYVDALEGYFVLDGVDEIARKEIDKALKIALPTWRIRLK